MSRPNPYTQRAIERNKRAIRAVGLYVTGALSDGTVLCSERPARPVLTIVPPAPLDPRARSMAIGTVYFISDGEFIKIGFATDWRSRIKELQTGNARRLSPLLIIEGGHRMEMHLHWFFRAARVNGEWFRPSAEIMAYIEEHRADGLSPGDFETP